MEKKQPVKIDDCEVRQARRGQMMEIVLKGCTKIVMSPKKFDFANILVDEDITPLSNIESKGVYDRVSVHVKVSKVKDPTEVPTGKKIAIVLLSIEYLTSFTIILKILCIHLLATLILYL